eukprot:jgi/Bigna1/84803/estExt_fgenesh1_pg.C_10091
MDGGAPPTPLLSQGQAALHIHKTVYAADLQTIKAVPTPSTNHDKGVEADCHSDCSGTHFMFGEPLEPLLCVRFLGVVVKILEPNRSCHRILVDDGTGVMEMRIMKGPLPPVGTSVDFLGKLRETLSQPNGERIRWIAVHGWKEKSDPQEELVRLLETVKNYDYYFNGKDKTNIRIILPEASRSAQKRKKVNNRMKPIPDDERNPLEEIPKRLDLSRPQQHKKMKKSTSAGGASRMKEVPKNQLDHSKKRPTPDKENKALEKQYCITPSSKTSKPMTLDLESPPKLALETGFDTSILSSKLGQLQKESTQGGVSIECIVAALPNLGRSQIVAGLESMMCNMEIYFNDGLYFSL